MNLTPTEKRIFEALASDFLPHHKDELFRMLGDELAGSTALPYHISNLRRKLAAEGYSLAGVSFANGAVTHYQILYSPTLAAPKPL